MVKRLMDTWETSPKQPATVKCNIHLIHWVNLQDSLYGHKYVDTPFTFVYFWSVGVLHSFQLGTFVPIKQNLGSDLNIFAEKQ